MTIASDLERLEEEWADADVGERSNAQLYITQLTRALDVPEPQPKGSGYEFEFAVNVVEPDGTETTKQADLFRQDHFLLEAKDFEEGKSNEALLRKAYGQARGYVTHLPGDPPPYLLTLDVARTLIIWDRWNGTYGGFNAGRRLNLQGLQNRPDEIALLRDIWQDPASRDPRAKANAVTQEIAGRLARLAASLEDRGHDHEEVARFLIRCVFTMFAEDVGLLEGEPFLEVVREVGLKEPENFAPAAERLWAAMDEGDVFGPRELMRFNGHFFRDRDALPLNQEDLVVLKEAAEADWRYVEPSIFGTLFTRALDPDERHRLGAQFTPRAFVERLVRPTIEEPVRERWRAVEASVFQLRERGRKKDLKEASQQLHDFHRWLRSLDVLDPACGSGNFLYVALAALKRIEGEVLRTLEDLTGEPDLMMEEVDPSQFHGIEVDAWAREIAELTLWIGYHQFWHDHHGRVRPPEPVLRDTGTLECRDAVLVWDEVVEDPDQDVLAGTPRVTDPETGAPVPKAQQRRAYEEYVNAREPDWPEADFIIGNPPYMGRGRQREEFGHGYVDALHEAYPDVNDNVDYVMYWWYKAARAVAAGETIRAGLITTNSITQVHNREVVEEAGEAAARVCWASPNHPWVDEQDAAQVRVAMTVIARDPAQATLVEVNDEGEVLEKSTVEALHADLTADVDVAGAAGKPLLANAGLSSQGFTLVGQGFVLDGDEARDLIEDGVEGESLIRRYLSGRDLTRRPRDQYVIDFGLMEENEARKHPVLYDLVRSRVKPMRDTNNRKAYRENWWRFGEPRPGFREAAEGLDRYIATSETSKHRFFRFLPIEAACSHAIVVLALEDAYYLGVLSSGIHATWALAAGGRLGVGDDPRYQKTMCFDPFPFPHAEEEVANGIRERAERIDELRSQALERDEDLTMTGTYNVVEKVRAGTELTEEEQAVYEKAACGVLADLHEELDEWVARAYGWPWPLGRLEILERLVDLHDQRRAEEEEGQIRWLRPAFQRPQFAPDAPEAPELELAATEEKEAPPEWPDDAIGQISVIKDVVGEEPGSPEEVTDRIEGGCHRLVERHLETLEELGEVQQTADGRYHLVPEPVVA